MFNKVFHLNFQRVPTSGAITGGKNNPLLALLSESQKLLLRGDVIVPDELSKLVIECKSRKEFPYHQLLDNCEELNKWINQIGCDLISKDLIGLIIVKINRRTPFVCYNKNYIKYPLVNPSKYILYNYNHQYFIIEEFTEEWIEKNKNSLLEWCKND